MHMSCDPNSEDDKTGCIQPLLLETALSLSFADMNRFCLSKLKDFLSATFPHLLV